MRFLGTLLGLQTDAEPLPSIALPNCWALVGLFWLASLVLIRYRSDDEIEAMIDNVRTRDEIDEVVEAELLD